MNSFENDGYGRLAWEPSRSDGAAASPPNGRAQPDNSADSDLRASGTSVFARPSLVPSASRRSLHSRHSRKSNLNLSSPQLFTHLGLDCRQSTPQPVRLCAWSKAGAAVQRQVLTANIAADMRQLRQKCPLRQINSGKRQGRPLAAVSMLATSTSRQAAGYHRRRETCTSHAPAALPLQHDRRLSIDPSNAQHLLPPTAQTQKGRQQHQLRQQNLTNLGRSEHFFAYRFSGAPTGTLQSMQLVGMACDIMSTNHAHSRKIVAPAQT